MTRMSGPFACTLDYDSNAAQERESSESRNLVSLGDFRPNASPSWTLYETSSREAPFRSTECDTMSFSSNNGIIFYPCYYMNIIHEFY